MQPHGQHRQWIAQIDHRVDAAAKKSSVSIRNSFGRLNRQLPLRTSIHAGLGVFARADELSKNDFLVNMSPRFGPGARRSPAPEGVMPTLSFTWTSSDTDYRWSL